MKLLARIEKTTDFWFLTATSFVFCLLRLPSLFEPYWYGDEGIYLVIGEALQHGRLLYEGIWDNKPPLLYVFYALFSTDQFTIRMVSLLFGLGSVIAFYFLAKKLFGFSRVIFAITALYAVLFGLPFLEGNIANSENFMLLPIIISGYFIYQYSEKLHRKNLIIAGILLSTAFLFKVVAIFDTTAFFLFLLITLYKKPSHIFSYLYKLIPFILAFCVLIVVTVLYFFINNAFGDFYNASFKHNIGYVGYGNTFIINQGLLLLKLLILFIFCVVLFIKRHAIPKNILFVLLWLAFSLFNAFFSQRPYTHYLLVLLPSFVLFIGTPFFLTTNSRIHKKDILFNSYKKIFIISLIVILIVLHKSFHLYQKNVPYYQNFVLFILNQKTVTDYQAFFDKNTPRDYILAQYVKKYTTPKDEIFIWGNNAQVYKMTNKLPPGRYTVAYHITSSQEALKETEKALLEKNPKLIIIMPGKNPFPFSLSGYMPIRRIDNIILYERTF